MTVKELCESLKNFPDRELMFQTFDVKTNKMVIFNIHKVTRVKKDGVVLTGIKEDNRINK